MSAICPGQEREWVAGECRYARLEKAGGGIPTQDTQDPPSKRNPGFCPSPRGERFDCGLMTSWALSCGRRGLVRNVRQLSWVPGDALFS